MHGVEVANVDTAYMRRAGKEMLSLALMDARNHTLRWAIAFETGWAESQAGRSDSPSMLDCHAWTNGRSSSIDMFLPQVIRLSA